MQKTKNRTWSLRAKLAQRVEAATVKLTKMGGQGVLIPGNMILTAAHCIEWNGSGSMVLGDYFIENIKTRRGKLQASPEAVEPVSDIAVLGPLDNQTFFTEANAFEEFCEETEPVPLCVNDLSVLKSIPVYIFTHEGRWVTGETEPCRRDAAMLWVTFHEPIQGGTSGSPIVNEAGEILAICSNTAQDQSESPQPRSHLTLPVWVWRIVERARKEVE